MVFSKVELKKTSFNDLVLDFDELKFIVNNNVVLIDQKIALLLKLKSSFRPELLSLAIDKLMKLKEHYLALSSDFKKIEPDNYEFLLSAKPLFFEKIRSLQSILSGTLTTLDYQSPSFGHALFSQAGSQTGKIIGTFNDYKRDAHLDESDYERKFVREYIDTGINFFIKSFMTASGMAAFTTIFNYLFMEGKIKNSIILGQSSYFQYKELLMKGLKEKIILTDESYTGKLIRLIDKHRPSVIFIDSLSNTKGIPVPDLPEIIRFLSDYSDKETYLVIDNTCLPLFCQPFKMAKKIGSKLRIIIFESLMKYHHFGLDRVTGGIIIASGKDAAKIFEYRKNSGTNISDSSVYSFPQPNRKLLKKRLHRHGRNAQILSSHLMKLIADNNTPLEEIIYPGLPNHKCHKYAESLNFQGGFFNLYFKKHYRSVGFYKKFINKVIFFARKEKVEFIAGTSFGLNNSRISLTSLWTDYGEPFIRIAVGTEDILSLEKVKTVFSKTLLSSNTKIPAKLLISLNEVKKKIGLDKLM